MAISNLAFLSRYLDGASVARVFSWWCLAAAVIDVVEDRFPPLACESERWLMLLTTAVVMGATFPYFWLNVAIGPVCLAIRGIYTMMFPPRNAPEKPRDIKTVKVKFITLADFECQELDALACRFYGKVTVKCAAQFTNVFAKQMEVLEGGCIWSNGQLAEWSATSIKARDQIRLNNVACTDFVESSEGAVEAIHCYLHKISAVNRVTLCNTKCNQLVLKISGTQGVIQLQNTAVSKVQIVNDVGLGGVVKVKIEGTGFIPDRIKFMGCRGCVDRSKFSLLAK
jgi:hypothetical protein